VFRPLASQEMISATKLNTTMATGVLSRCLWIVDALDMALHSARLGKVFPADSADKWSFQRVRPRVVFEVGTLAKRPLANLAL